MNVKISRLSNGLIVATDPMPELESASIGVWANCGGRNEPRPLMGISHMLEHMAFKGTRRRTARQIACEIEAVGGSLNAFTGREQTAYQARVLKDDVPLALDLLADILIEPAFAPDELERERGVVLQEIGEARDTPDDIVFDHLQEIAFPAQPMGWPILGDEKSVSAIGREDLIGYLGGHYRAGSMTVAAAGAVEHEKILAIAEEKFAALPVGEIPPTATASYRGGDKRTRSGLEQAHVAIAFPAVAANDPDYFAAQVYASALGGGSSSRLFQEAREKRGLCYTISAFLQCARDYGLLVVYTGVGDGGAGEISAVVAGEMAALAEAASAEETARARAQLKANLLMGMEHSSTRIDIAASHLFYHGRAVPAAEMVEKLEAVSADDVRRFGTRVMNTTAPAFAAVGKTKRLESYKAFSQRFGGGTASRP
jgi:predicted Zn-dependent peptidase